MKNDKLTQEQIKAVLEALDKAVDEGPWEQSNFLRVIGKNLKGIRDNFSNHVDSLTQRSPAHLSSIANKIALRRGQQLIFVSLYSSDGSNIRSWEQIISNLPRQMISRPIYAQEHDVKEIIKTKENKMNEAYVSVYIAPDDILPIAVDKLPVDKLGKKILTLKDKTLTLDNVERFVHQTGIYRYSQGRLIKEDD